MHIPCIFVPWCPYANAEVHHKVGGGGASDETIL
jgi:hypothetical protein